MRRPAVALLALVAVGAAGCSGGTTSTTAANGATSTTSAGAGTSVGSGPPGTTAPAGTKAPPAVPARFVGHTSEVYANPANWLCQPGIAKDLCTSEALDSTVIRADGTTELIPRQVAKAPKADCFYVYPTVNYKPGGGNDLDMQDMSIEPIVVNQQAARFADVCTMYAPLYRQMNLSAYSAPKPEFDTADALAYGDVVDAFRYYMATFNKGRPIVLIGHSQGSGHLQHLLQDEFDDDPAFRGQLVSALLIGGFVRVPVGKDVGGSFKNIPLCRAADQHACVVTYNSYSTDPAPDATVRFGPTLPDGTTGGCVNPAALAGGPGSLKPYVGSSPATDQVASVTTPFVQLPDALSAECHTDDKRTYLAVSISTKPGDKRDVTQFVVNAPGSGLHQAEVNLTMGNLVDLVTSELAALG